MQSALCTPSAPPFVPVWAELRENSRQGFAAKNPTWNPGPNVANSTTAIGLRASLFLEGFRQSDRARYYNPAIGRFISEDPMGLAGGINEYAYVGDSPTNFIDPSGLDKKNPCTKTTGYRVTQGILGATNLTLGGLKTAGLGAADTLLVALAPETGLTTAFLAAGITTYGVTSIGGQEISGLGQLYTAFSGDAEGGEQVSQAGDILAGPLSGLSTLVVTGNVAQAQRNANYESAITAGAGFVNSRGVGDTIESGVDYGLSLFGLSGAGCHP